MRLEAEQIDLLQELALRDLAAAGLIPIRRQNVHGDFDFTVAPEAHEFLANELSAKSLSQVENEIVTRCLNDDHWS